MLLKFRCPSCEKLLSVDDAQAGITGPCPYCKNIITAPKAEEATPTFVAAPADKPAPPEGIVCPECHELVPERAKYCPFCGYRMDVPGQEASETTASSPLPGGRELVRAPVVDTSGFIYVLINPSMDGVVKIGKTQRDPAERAKELSAATGIPTPFVVAYEAFFNDCSRAEQCVHAILEAQGYRIAVNKEFFSISPTEAIQAVIAVEQAIADGQDDGGRSASCTDEFEEEDMEADVPPWQSVLDEAYNYYIGSEDTLEDPVEALRLFKQAARMGSAEAYLRIGDTYRLGRGVREDNEQALEWYKEGARRGWQECYAAMAPIYMEQEHTENARKCWNRYFASDAFRDEKGLRWLYGWQYCRTARRKQMPIIHLEALRSIRDEIMKAAQRFCDKWSEDDDCYLAVAEMSYIRYWLFPEDRSNRQQGNVYGCYGDGEYGCVRDQAGNTCKVWVSEFMGGKQRLQNGVLIEFDVIDSPRGPIACNIKAL